MAKITSDSPHMTPPAQGIRMQNTSVGSGSRPTPSKIKIPTSAPDDPMTMGRQSPGGNDVLR